MSYKPFISLVMILSLVLASVCPMLAEVKECAGSSAVAAVLQRNAQHHDDTEAPHVEGHHHSHSHAEADHDGITEADHHGHGSLRLEEASYCCLDHFNGARAAITDAVLPGRLVLNQPIAHLYVVLAPSFAGAEKLITVHFKIGSSPPYLASISHPIYLRTLSLLI